MFCKYMDAVPPPHPSQCSVNTHASYVLMSYLSSALRLMFSRNSRLPSPHEAPPPTFAYSAIGNSIESVGGECIFVVVFIY